MTAIAEWRSNLPALTTDQMREVDRVMMQDIGITLMQMMENAGRHLATLARERLGGNVEKKRVIVLAGRGNNGGGGMVAARRLANWDAAVSVILTGPPEEYRDVPGYQLGILNNMHVPIFQAQRNMALRGDVILDALIGYGLRGPPLGMPATLIQAANASGVRILALDAPSGLDTTTGTIYDPCIRAEATLTLALPKVGLVGSAARAVVGELYVADISVPPSVYAAMGIQVPNLFVGAEIVHVRD
ncbi:MAG: NAD(P)H-hydrate epimerase [Chloroflexi bacterium]|nr:NAD(P)H-hydrate epimerase [Chloroflexota bacterium]